MSQLYTVFIGILIVATVAMLGYCIYYYVFRGLLAPTRQALARVILKRQEGIEVDTPAYGGRFGWILSMLLSEDGNVYTTDTTYRTSAYSIVFQFVNGYQQEFSVPEEVYASVSEMDEGLLVYKGNLFRHFYSRRTDPGSVPQYPPRTP